MKYYKIKDIKPPCLVTFEKHNGRGRLITYRTVFVSYMEEYNGKYYISYDTYTGSGFDTIDPKEAKVCDIYKVVPDYNSNAIFERID